MSNYLASTPRKLGKKAAVHDPRTLQLANYLDTDLLPAPPAWKNYSLNVNSWPMFANDRLGDCTCAGAGHIIQEYTTNAGTPVILTDDQIIAAYSAITGYDPATGANDNGAVETDVLNYWRKTGIGGHKIGAYAALQPSDKEHIKSAVSLFTGCYIGVSMPISAQGQHTWSVPPGGAVGQGAPGSWGGHCVNVVGYNAQTLVIVTWGALYRMTWQFWATYCDEAYVVLSQDLFNGKGQAPSGFNLAQLTADLALVQN